MAQAQDISSVTGELTSEEVTQIREQLERILSSTLFNGTRRMKRFLRYITEQTLLGQGDRLKGYSIGLEVFDRSDDFDPQADTIVRVQAGQLRRRLDLYYATHGQDDLVRLTVPKGGYAPRFEFRKSSQRKSLRQTPMLALLEGSQETSRPGVVVLTFDDLTPSKEADFFAEGLTAELVGDLVQFRHLRIIAVRPTVSARTPSMSVEDIGKKFDALFVLSGSVRRAGSLFRVVVNLISTETGEILFQKTFDRQYTPENLFEIQENIASNVAACIAAPFGHINRYNWRQRKGQRDCVSANEAVLQYYAMNLTANLSEAESLLAKVEEITRKNKNFSSGFAIRGLLHVYLCTQCIPPSDKSDGLHKAQAMANQALKLDPINSMAHFAAYQVRYHESRMDQAQAHAQRAMALNPNDYSMLQYFALTHSLRGNNADSKAFDAASRRLIATTPPWFEASRLCRLLSDRDFEEAADLDVQQNDSVALWFLKLAALGHLGRQEEGMTFFARMNEGKTVSIQDWWETLSVWHPVSHFADIIKTGWRNVGLDI